MSYHGKFVWCELMTADPDAAADFYGKVVGWTRRDFSGPERTYLIMESGPSGVGGIMPTMPGARPGWLAYVAADDVDAAAKKIEAAGGTVHKQPEDIPTIGRFAVVGDPQCAVFVIFKPIPPQNPPPPADPMSPGQVGWHELHTSDWEGAFAFYSGLFGWTKGEAIPMGEMGTYQIFQFNGAMAGGMMNAMPPRPPFWLNYFNVDAVDAAIERVKQAGGEVFFGPQEVPGGAFIAQARDPQGNMFAFSGPKG